MGDVASIAPKPHVYYDSRGKLEIFSDSGKLFISRMVTSGQRLHGELHENDKWLVAELALIDGSHHGMIRLRRSEHYDDSIVFNFRESEDYSWGDDLAAVKEVTPGS